jgi:hypothetical protein
MRRFSRWIAPLALLLAANPTYADTLNFKDGHAARGKVLAEFRDYLYVQLGSDLPQFVRRSELESVLGANDEPLEASTTPSPALAVASPVGEVQIEAENGTPTVVKDLAFAGPNDRVVTGDTGIARLDLPSQSVVKIGPSTAVRGHAAIGMVDQIDLEHGQAFLTPGQGRSLGVTIADGVRVGAKGGSVELERTPSTVAIMAHSGTAQFESSSFRALIPPEHALKVETVNEGTKATAGPENAASIEISVGTESRTLAPGESLVVSGSGALATQTVGSWKLTRIQGGVLVRLAHSKGFTAVGPNDVEQLRLDTGDAIATESRGEAVLTRDDGASLTLQESSEAQLSSLVEVAAGAVKVEALREPVSVAVPVGQARLTYASLEARRLRREGTAFELAGLEGETRVTLPAALLPLPKGARVRLDGTGDESTVHALQGTVALATAAQPEAGDPEVSVAIEPGHEVVARANHARGVRLRLEGGRVIDAGPERVAAKITVSGDDPKIVFGSIELTLEKELSLGLGASRSSPLLRFETGAAITIGDDHLHGRVGPPGIVTLPDGTAVSFRKGVEATLRGAEASAGALLTLRRDDRFEIPHHASASLSRRDNGRTMLKLGDGRALLVEDGAPPVQERLTSEPTSSAAGPLRADVGEPSALALTMPGAAPLTIPATRRVAVLATRQGEFIILDDPSLLDASESIPGLHPLSGTAPGNAFPLDPTPNHLPEVLAEPPPASPTR